MNYTLYQDNGRIVSTLNCQKEDLALNITKGLNALEDSVPNTDDYYVVNEKLVKKPNRPSLQHDFDYSAKQWVPNIDRAWLDVRKLRDSKLSGSDWRVTKATETGKSMPKDWVTYREALRNITEQLDPLAISWPIEPT